MNQLPSSPPYPPNAEDDEIDILELWDTLMSGWQWIAGATILAAVSSIAVALLMTPIYRSQVVMVSAEDPGARGGGASALAAQFGGIADLAGVSLGATGSKAEAMAVLKSRSLAEGYIKEMNLLPILFEEKWDAANQRWKVDDPTKIPTIEAAYKFLSENVLKIDEDKKTGVITLSVEWKDRIMAAQWANDLVRRANDTMRARAVAEAQASIDYLHLELGKTGVVEIQQAIYRLLEANYKTSSIANTREQYAFKVIDPAVPADANRKVRPKRAMIVILTTLIAGFISVLGVFMYHGIRNMKRRRAAKNGLAA